MEVWITLDESEMDILLCDQEFLAFVTVDPNLLQCFSLIGMASLDLDAFCCYICRSSNNDEINCLLDCGSQYLIKIKKLFKDEAIEEKSERARMASFVSAMTIADLVKTTLGPKGMDKILQSTGGGHNVTVTNDGATILKSLHIDNPAAKVLVDISKVQDDEVGDGTTSVVILAGELLREVERLLATNIHPMTIISGSYRMAAEYARNALLQKVMDNKEDAEKFKEDLMKIAMTTLSSKILSQDEEHFANLAVDAVMRLQGSTNLEAIKIIKKPGGSLKDSFLDEGWCNWYFVLWQFILDKKIGIRPKHIENAKILVANTAMDVDKVKIYGARVHVDSMSTVAEIEGAEKKKMREKVQKIIALGINWFVNQQLIYNFPDELFADARILAIEHADFDGIEHLALVTGAERSLHDALCMLSQMVNDNRVLLGGRWPEMVMAKAVDELAWKTPGKKSHTIETFSRALVASPTIIADNAGLDSAELVA
ncbi:T-complex protein 1 subunit beta [Camellia lanceoleosa]|uniref:T-complex protein 1 subunit beta n=1 Tax=Camellia lanceoleosa TaxID=1840588 RepID=A0ACC0HI49_9ERIC|nr:T-complex protein 1 subunit beta [Camellia lanceoleosa]